MNTGEHSHIEQQSHLDNQQHENAIQNQSDAARSVNIIETAKKMPMNPTPLYICFFFS